MNAPQAVPPDPCWVDCDVRLPRETRDPDSGAFNEFRCSAKLACADLADALDLDRWLTQALQHLWRAASCNGDARARELVRAQWCIDRSMKLREHGWRTHLCDVVANVLESLQSAQNSAELLDQLVQLAAGLRDRDPQAVQQLAVAYVEELRAR